MVNFLVSVKLVTTARLNSTVDHRSVLDLYVYMYEVNCSKAVIFYNGYYLHCQCILSIQGRNYRFFWG